MPDDAAPHDVNQHLLGPHVVGQRVVVRRVLRGQTGPSGGPALTDVLGTCLSWADGVCVLRSEDETTTTIAIADIVSGKPVPPRPSTRHRVSPTEAQRRALALWPDLHTEPLGDWVLRHSPTSSARRANSVLAIGPSGVEGDYDAVMAFYAARTGRPLAAVVPESAEEDLFRAHGWAQESSEADSLFQIAGVAAARRALRSRPVPSLPSMPEPTFEARGDLVTVRIGEEAEGLAAYAEDWVGFRGIHVAPRARRRGLGLAVLAELLGWGAERGATTAYLQVLADNAAAVGLYESLGFRTHHRYRYLAAPGSI